MTSPKALKYRKQLEHVMAQMATTTDQHQREILLEIARQYDKLAAWVERQENPKP